MEEIIKKLEDHERRLSKLEELLKSSESKSVPIKKMSIAEFFFIKKTTIGCTKSIGY
ncbi:MAG: hypothetical protein QXQ53_04930 [Candidatus Methanosuratincola sp.]